MEIKEDDLKTDFYTDLTPIGKNKDKKNSASNKEESGFHVPIFYSSTQQQSSTQNSAFKEAIQASHKKVKQNKNDSWSFYSFLKINANSDSYVTRRGVGFDVQSGFLTHIQIAFMFFHGCFVPLQKLWRSYVQ